MVTNMMKNVFLICCTWLCLLCCACSTAPETSSGCNEHYRLRNGIACETFKQEHLSESFLDVTFSQRPYFSGGNNFWVLSWNEIDAILPVAAYEHVNYLRGSGVF